MVLITENDPRGPKAVALAADAGQWLKCRAADGRKAYGVPSAEAGRYYLVTRQHCTCPDFRKRALPCKHMLAVQLHCELIADQAAVTPSTVEAPFPVAVRVSEDEIAFRSRREIRNSQRYDDIFKRFEQD